MKMLRIFGESVVRTLRWSGFRRATLLPVGEYMKEFKE